MEKNKLLVAGLCLYLLVSALITSAQNVISQKGLITAVFKLQQGVMKIYLPNDFRPGDGISGCIVTEPAGKNAKQTRRNLDELNSYSISIYDSKIPIDKTNKLFHISVPAGKPGSCRLELRNAAGAVLSELTVPSMPEKDPQFTSSEFNIPSHALTGAPFRITGPFDGDATNTKCLLDNKPMEILAESPRVCIVSFPSTAGGMHTLSNQENGKPVSTKMISGVVLSVSAGKLNLLRGEKTDIKVQVTGLGNLPDTAHLTLINTTPDIITLVNGNTITVSIPPKPDNTMGTYTQSFIVQSVKTGTFSVNADIELPDTQPSSPGSGKTGTSPVTKHQALLVFGEDLNSNKNGEHIDTKENELYKVFAFGNTIYIFLKDTFVNELVVTNPGTASVEDRLAEYADVNYQAPSNNCDSLFMFCRKNAALNVFWGDVYSVFEEKSEYRKIKGETFSKSMNYSLLITRGWEINCCTGQYQLKLFFEARQEGSNGKESHLTFSKILRNGKPCPVICQECQAACEEAERNMEDARKQMEEKRKKNAGKK